ncbi:MAG: metallophosphoesterase [Candidatus Thorarchaeota archaeon]
MVRVAHMSDSHIGSTVFQLIERSEDTRECFRKAVETVLEEDPDILIHTGDLFDAWEPSNEDMHCVTEVLSQIRERVRVYVVQGNHDLPPGARRGLSPVRILEVAGLIRSTGEDIHKRYVEKIGNEVVEVHLISYGRDRDVRAAIDSIKDSGRTTLVFSHILPMDEQYLPAHFHYFGYGHKHVFQLDKDADIGRPGSTCIVDWSRERGERKMIVIDVDEDGNDYKILSMPDVRPFVYADRIDITGMGAREAEERVRNSIDRISSRSWKKPPIVILNVGGMIDSETQYAINRVDLVDYGMKTLSPLFVHINPMWECHGPRPVTLTDPLDPRRSVEEYVAQTGTGDVEALLSILDEVRGVKK